MIKVRLWGEVDEINELKAYLKTLPRIRVKSCSAAHSDRGESEYKRIYIELDIMQASAVPAAQPNGTQQTTAQQPTGFPVVIQELIESLYDGVNYDVAGRLSYTPAQLARAFAIAKQLCEFGIVDLKEVEAFVRRVT